jgi:flagellar motor switch/type III secretory pathway protein FliN
MSMNRAGDVKMDVTVVLGTSQVTIGELLQWCEGSLVELGHSGRAQDVDVEGVSFKERARESTHGMFPVVDVEVNGSLFAKAEVVTVAEQYGVRVLNIIDQNGGE